MTWRDLLVEILESLGGHAKYKDIFEAIQKDGRKNLVKSSVERTLEEHASETASYKAGNLDLFYCVEGLGGGHWGLKDYTYTPEQMDATQDDASFAEGKARVKEHVVRERNFKLIAEAKRRFKQQHGRLYCQVCGFDFEATYGKLGEDFIEAHHTIPVSLMEERDVTRVEDMAMVCSNCHSMLHRRKPWPTWDELRDILER